MEIADLPEAVYGIVTNPIYAGAFVYGRSTHRIRLEQGRKRIVRGLRQTQENWSVLILDHHEGYISWEEYERNIEVIAHNAGNKGLMVRRGAALLSGLLRCGHCGRKMQVNYAKGTHRYFCVGANQADGPASMPGSALGDKDGSSRRDKDWAARPPGNIKS